MSGAPEISVVIATYNRPELIERTLSQLGEQTLSPSRFEVVVVDDGSKEPVIPRLEARAWPFHFNGVRQANGGAAVARHTGIQHAKGGLIVIVDDDMQVPASFLEAHLAAHGRAGRAVVFGRIRCDPAIEDMPLFERWYAQGLDRGAAAIAAGAPVKGNMLCTGNVSFRRADYLEVGGFDPTLERSEDAELGLRLEALGVTCVFSEEAYTLHGSDHTDPAKWLGRTYRYGRFDLRIARKHPGTAHADPWRYLFQLGWGKRLLAVQSVVVPEVSRRLAPGLLGAGEAVAKLGFEKGALALTGAVYGMEYFRGLRDECGSPFASVRAVLDYLEKAARSVDGGSAPAEVAQALRALRDLERDHAGKLGAETKYGHHGETSGSLPRDLVQKVGLQIMAGYRLMRFFHLAGRPLAARITSRLIRHAYGSDIHWEAELAPGTIFVHGMGVAISHAARVGEGCILSQNVTLGLGNDPATREVGAPTLEANVHVGPGATLLGPIRIGTGSKIMAGAVVTESVPPGSLVESPRPMVRPRLPAQPQLAHTR